MASRGTFARMVGPGLWKFLWIAGSAEEETCLSRGDSAKCVKLEIVNKRRCFLKLWECCVR